MQETNRRFEVSYHDTSLRDGTCDVSFTLTEDGEDALFSTFEREIGGHVRDGVFPDQKIHLFKRLTEQRTEHPPWIEAKDDLRTYDLELSEWDYHLLSTIIGESLSNVLGPDGADRYGELVDVWQDVTEQMRSDTQDVEQMTFSDVPSDPEMGQFECFIQDGQIRVYSNDQDERWYVCTECDTSFAEIGDEHDCSQWE